MNTRLFSPGLMAKLIHGIVTTFGVAVLLIIVPYMAFAAYIGYKIGEVVGLFLSLLPFMPQSEIESLTSIAGIYLMVPATNYGLEAFKDFKKALILLTVMIGASMLYHSFSWNAIFTPGTANLLCETSSSWERSRDGVSKYTGRTCLQIKEEDADSVQAVLNGETPKRIGMAQVVVMDLSPNGRVQLCTTKENLPIRERPVFKGCGFNPNRPREFLRPLTPAEHREMQEAVKQDRAEASARTNAAPQPFPIGPNPCGQRQYCKVLSPGQTGSVVIPREWKADGVYMTASAGNCPMPQMSALGVKMETGVVISVFGTAPAAQSGCVYALYASKQADPLPVPSADSTPAMLSKRLEIQKGQTIEIPVPPGHTVVRHLPNTSQCPGPTLYASEGRQMAQAQTECRYTVWTE